MKKERGITLVALIITIIILVILSAVTIQNTIGEHGLIDMATESAVRSKIAEYKDGLDQIGIEIMTENAPKNLKGREYLEEFKKKVDESELFKDKRSAEIIGGEEGETEEKLRVVTKEGFVYDVTEKEIKYVGSVGEEGFTPLPDPELKDPNITITPSDTEWVDHKITATIEVSDEFKDFTIQYTTRTETSTETLSGWKKYDLESDIEIPTNETIFVRVIDNVGNATKTASKTISNIDTILPEEPTDVKVTDTKTNSITVTATAKDGAGTDDTHYKEESGIAQIIIELKGEIQGTEQTVTETKEVSVEGTAEVTVEHTFTGLTQGKTYEITVKAIDKAGNESKTIPITGGKTETVPELKEGTIDFTLDKNTWTKGPVNVTITATTYTDQGYKLQYTTTSPTADDWQDYTGAVTMTKNGTVYARLRDDTSDDHQYGTVATATGKVSIIDTQIPEDPTGSVVTKTTNSIKVTASAKDRGETDANPGEQSGIDHIIFELTGGEKKITETKSVSVEGTTEATAEHTFTGLTQGTNYTITVKAVDKAGNESANATSITGGKTETVPELKEGTIDFTLDKNTWTKGPVNVTITATTYTDQGYKLQYTTTSPTANDWQDYTGSVKMTKNGTVYARLRDDTSEDHQYGTVATATGKVSIIDTQIPEDPTGSVVTKTTNSIKVTASAKDRGETDANPGEQSGIDHIIFELTGGEKKITETKSVSVEGTTEATAEHTFTGLTQGTNYTITVKAVDKAENVSTIKTITGGNTETVPGGEQLKTGTITFTPDKTNWTKEPVNVEITSTYTAENNGGYKLQYRTTVSGSTDWKDYTGAVKMTTNGTIFARLKDSTDQVGAEATATQVINIIDTIVPTDMTEGKVTATTTNSITVTAKAKDAAGTVDGHYKEESGINQIIFVLTGTISGKQQTLTEPKSVPVTGTAEASATHTFTGLTQNTPYTITAKAVDKAGNVSAIKTITGGTTEKIPDIAEGKITFKPSKSTWTNQTVNVEIIASEYTNQGYKLQYAIKDLKGAQPQAADWNDYNGTSVAMTTNGIIYARLRDNTSEDHQYGTQATATQRIDIIDTQAPSKPTDVTTEAVVKDGKKHYIKVTASAQDVAETIAKPGEQSGIAKLQFKIDSGDWQDVTAATTGTVKATNITYTSGALTTGSHTIQVQAVDKAGNVSGAVNATAVSIDATNPGAPKIVVTSGTQKPGVPNTYTSAIKVTITGGTDNVTGQSTAWSVTETKESGSLDGPATKELTFSNNGTYTISATTTDTSGNTASSSLTVIKAGTPPTVTASADRSYEDGTHKITIKATGKDAEGGTLTYTVSYGTSETYGNTKTTTGTAGEEVTITIDSGLDMATTYYYKVDVKDTDNTSAQTPYTNSVKTYCIGEWCAGGVLTKVNCTNCGGRRRFHSRWSTMPKLWW